MARGPGSKKKTRRKHKHERNCDTGLRRYRDQAEATAAIHAFEVHSTREVKPIRTFECPLCRGWHTTSKPLE